MSSKAFRVFNKRTKRVEENLHVDFLENKAIEKGTKDATSQEVKKDMSSLRYIALSNWVHEALLESSSSNAQDTCNADAPESSGNSNPTATTTNPPADQMETLTVETTIPTVSSPVPTACFKDSLKPSIDSHGEEADVSNMETTITTSPTPTLRIYKDHPKSQIIGPVDTPIQTRNKSKEMEEQSFNSTIHQKTNPALLQFCLFSCFLSQVEPKKIFDALQDPSWVEAMQEKLLQFKIQNDKRGIVIRNKARLVAQRHTQEEGIDYDEVFAPVVRIEAIRLFLAYASFMGFTVYQMDVKSALLYGTIDEEVYVMQPFGFQDPPEETGIKYLLRCEISTMMASERSLMASFEDLKSFLPMNTTSNYLIRANLEKGEIFGISGKTQRVSNGFSKTSRAEGIYPGTLPLDRVEVLEKYKHNQDFYQIMDFVEASHIRIETTDEGTKILATVDGKPRTISESSIRRNLKLKDEAGISSLPDVELFENLTLIGYNILPNQKFTFQKGHSNEPHHTPSPEAQQTSPTTHSSPSLPPVTTKPLPTVTPSDTPQLRQYTRRDRIAQSLALSPVADEPVSPIGDDSQGEACPTNSGLAAEQDRATITKTSTFPSDSTPRVTSLAADEGNMQQTLNELTDLCTRLQRQQDEMASKITAQDLEIATLKARGRSLDEGDEVAIERSIEKGSNDTEEIVNVLTSFDAATVLSSGVAEVPTGSGFIPTAGPPATGVPTSSDVVPTASPIFTTATVATPYTRRKGKEKMMMREDQIRNEQIERDAEIARIHAKEELQMMSDGLDRNNETVAKYLQEYCQFAAELPIGERIELISDLVKYQDNYGKVLKYQTQQKKPLSKKQQKKLHMPVLKSHAGWKVRHFKGMTLEEIKEKFDPVWKKIQDFIPIGSKEESERFKRKRLRLEQDSAKNVKTLEEVPEEKLKEMMQLIPVEEHFDREDLNQLWALVKETLNIRSASNDKEKELWVELKTLYESDVEDNCIPTASEEFPLAEQFPTANEDKLPLLSQSDATVEELCDAVEVKEENGVKDEEVVIREDVVVISSSLDMLTNSCLGGIMVSLIFLKGLDEEALVKFMVESCKEDEDNDRNKEATYLIKEEMIKVEKHES
nr:hypothetical protein [Tanacetum cinerariifolium]